MSTADFLCRLDGRSTAMTLTDRLRCWHGDALRQLRQLATRLRRAQP